MLRWYCWLIFFTVAVFSTLTFPTDGDVEENKNLLVIGNENDESEDMTIENRMLSEEDEDDEDDDDDEEEIFDDGTLDVTDRRLRRKRPQKFKKDKDGKKPKKTKCVCFGKKRGHHSRKRPQHPGKPKPKPSSASTPAGGSSSQRPTDQGNQGGSQSNRPNNGKEERPRP